MNRKPFVVERISDGLQFGHGSISTSEAGAETLHVLDETIRSPQILVPIGRDDEGVMIDDDGCGDGRGVKLTFNKYRTFKRSLHRPKVFGGAVAMKAAGLIGTGRAKEVPLPQVFSRAIDVLEEQDVDFGAHTDEHAHGDNSGCGAIDRAPEAVQAALKYEQPIRDVIRLLGSDTSQLDVVYSNWRQYLPILATSPEYKGIEIADKIIEHGKVLKELEGEHRECAIILNTIPGYTVDQELVRQATSGEAQTFAVDVWRLQEITAKAYSGQNTQEQAYLSKLIYTLAVSAVLTNGDLPVYMTQSTTPV